MAWSSLQGALCPCKASRKAWLQAIKAATAEGCPGWRQICIPWLQAIRKLQQEGTVDKVTRDWIGQGVSCFGVDSTLQSQQLQLGSFAGGTL